MVFVARHQEIPWQPRCFYRPTQCGPEFTDVINLLKWLCRLGIWRDCKCSVTHGTPTIIFDPATLYFPISCAAYQGCAATRLSRNRSAFIRRGRTCRVKKKPRPEKASQVEASGAVAEMETYGRECGGVGRPAPSARVADGSLSRERPTAGSASWRWAAARGGAGVGLAGEL